MSDDSEKKWIVKTENGKIRGPYSTERVLEKISQGFFTGDELISRYPGGRWFTISQDPTFYDKLLQVLSGEENTLTPIKKKPRKKTSSEQSKSSSLKSKSTSKSQSHNEEFFRNSERMFDEEEFESLPEPELEPFQDIEKTRIVRLPKNKSENTKTRSRMDDIELTNIKKKIHEQVLKKSKLPIFIVIAVVAIGFGILMLPSKSGGRLHLQAPSFKTKVSAYSKSEADSKTKDAVSNYLKDTLEGYKTAQLQLVNLIERDPKNLNLYGLLCLTYFELWPYSYQDANDLKIMEYIALKASEVNPTHLYAYTCKAMNLYVRGKISETKALSEQVLDSYRGNGAAPIPFYYIKASLLNLTKDYVAAQGYANSAHQLWPQWLKAYLLDAKILMQMGNYSEAYNILSNIYNSNKSHPATKILIGVIEFTQFANTEKAKAFLNSGLKDKDQMTYDMSAKGYMVLAQIALSENDQQKALDYAKKSYSFNSTNETVKNMIVQLGGRPELEKTEVKAHQLVLEGDQFVREGDCQSAQAHFKSAFEMDSRLSIAAFKAGRCLWDLSFSVEAIEWMKKAIKSDPKMIDAYIELADYYSQRFDFVAAARTLGAAQTANPKSHEVLRGYALVELRRNNPKATNSYAKQALIIYQSDVESMILSAKAHLKLRDDLQAGYSMAAKAIELDSSNREAQVVYARALAAIQGVEYGVNHLQELINTYPLIYEYRLALGRLYLEDERYNDAEAVFRQLIEIQDKPKEALVELGKVLKYQNDIEGALEALFRAAVFDPADAEPFFLAGILLLDVNKSNDAKLQFERVISINKSYPLVRYQIGRAELMMKNPKAALHQANEEKKVNPNLAAAYSLAAEAYSDLKQYDLCASEYQQAIKLRPQGADIYVRVASCYRKAGNFDSALSMLNIASKVESGNPDIYKEQGALFEARGDLEKAVQAYRQYFVLDPNAPDRNLIEKRIQSLQN